MTWAFPIGAERSRCATSCHGACCCPQLALQLCGMPSRGVIKAEDPAAAAAEYQRVGWEAYEASLT